ncbi:MAG: 50S ribosomal protein L11 methyltransferase [Methylocella sp.]
MTRVSSGIPISKAKAPRDARIGFDEDGNGRADGGDPAFDLRRCAFRRFNSASVRIFGAVLGGCAILDTRVRNRMPWPLHRGVIEFGDLEILAEQFFILAAGLPQRVALLGGREETSREDQRLEAAVRLFLDGWRKACAAARATPHCRSRPCMVAAAMLEGLPPNGAAHVMRLSCEEAAARRIAAIIVETFDPATTAAAAFEESPDPSDWNKGLWIVEAYFGIPPDEANVRALVAVAAGDAAARAATFGRVDERDWVAASLEGLKSVRAGRFLIHGAHGRDAVKANDVAIEIEAALAFGTGHHGSTRGCLLMLDLVARKRRPRAILDLGTGSGVLAIAAAKLFKRKICAGDIDPVCVQAAGANARRNRVANFVRPVLAKGVAHPVLRAEGPYDLVLANILAGPLRDLAPQIARLAAPRAEIILSGLIGRDVPGVAAAHRTQGTALARRIDIDGWATLLMRRGGLREKP